MTCYIRMKRTFLQGLLWLYLFGFGFMALSLEPGFLDFDNLPDTNFTCVGKVIGGYYADLETNCQMFHVCTIGQLDEPMDIRFLCLNGTVFDQETRVCERIDEVDCTKSEQFYSLNLELYGNSQPSNLEEISETEQPLIIKSTLPTTTTTTEPTRKTTRNPFYTTVTSPTTGGSTQQQISAHHFSLIDPNSSDIRFNPEEINISLHPGAPPDIRTKPHLFYSDKKKETNSEKTVVVTTHRSVVSTHRSVYEDGGREANTQKSLSGYNQATPGDINFGFTLRNADVEDYHTEDSEEGGYHYHTEFRPSQEYSVPHHNPQHQALHQPQQYTSSTYRNEYTPTTHNSNNYQLRSSTTARNHYIESLKPPALDQQSQYHHPQSERTPQRLQLPLPLLPTLPPLTFSSPAPFSLQQRIETKRYTKDHFPPPRIVISASASVSDASGRRLNYSLGTIGTAPLLKHPPSSYDEYKDEDVGLDPFYHDVQKVKNSRKRRSLPQSKRRRRSDRSSLKHSDIIKNDEDAIHVLKFLFDWYRNEKTNPARFTTPISAPLNRDGIVSINDELSPEKKEHINGDTDDDNIDFKFKTSDVFNKKSRYSIVGDGGASVNHEEVKKVNNIKEEFTIMQNEDPENGDEIFQHEEDYVNDNFEPVAYRNTFESEKKNSRNYKDEFNRNSGRNDYKYKYVNEKEEPVDYVHEFSKEPGVERSSQTHKYENESSPDYEREFNEERKRGPKDEYVSTTFEDGNENDTKYSLPNEYIDDNIEPIYYKERNEERQIVRKNSWKTDERKEEPLIGDSTTETFGSTELFEKTPNIDPTSEESTLSYSKLPDREETTTEFYQEQANTQDNDVNPKLLDNIIPYTTPTETTEITSHPTTISGDEFETTLTTEAPTTTTKRFKSNRRRGRRKYNSSEAKDKEVDFKKALIEKLIVKPVRAKDDYAFLRTVHIHTTTTGERLDGHSLTEINTEPAAPINTHQESVHFVPTLTENYVITEGSPSETTTRGLTKNIYDQKETEPESKLSDVFLTTSSTTVTSIDSKRRRGKQRSHVDSNRKKSSRRRKTTKVIEPKEYYPSSNITYLGSVDIIRSSSIESVSSESIGSMSVLEENLNPIRNSSGNVSDMTSKKPVAIRRSGPDHDIPSQNHEQVSAPHLEVIETTTDHVNAPKMGRGKTKFLNLPDLDQQSTVIDISRTTPTSVMEQVEMITTARLATTEGSEKVEEGLYSGSTIVYGKDNATSSERIEDIYATSFVPTTESIHITKKKQLKDNLLNSELIPTTESSLDIYTNRITDITEEFTEETSVPTTPARTEKLLELFEEMEITTGGYFSDLTITDVDEFERTTATTTENVQNEAVKEAHLIRNESVPRLSKAMHLLSIVVEEKVEDNLDSTTNTPQELGETTEGYDVTEASTGGRASSYFESSTESLLKVDEVEEGITADQVKLEEEYKTEALTTTTEVITETPSANVETKAAESSTATTLAVEMTTTIANDYSQIPTTFEQTTFAPETTERTTTMRSYSRKERPNRRRPNHYRSSYRHRFSSEYSTKKPVTRKQAVENEIISPVYRKGKKLTTEKDNRESLTEYPLLKSVHPTQAERTLVTTPFSRKTTVKKHFFFNCFGKAVDKFYPDLRDCRLFHYCTQGYNKNQLLDMKFVCDLNTFFDDEKLICTKIKPKRCL